MYCIGLYPGPGGFRTVLRIRIILMRIRIRILLVTRMQIRNRTCLSLWGGSGSRSKLPNKGSKPWKGDQIGSFSLHFGLPSANWCGSRSESCLSFCFGGRSRAGSSLLRWSGSGSYLSILCGSRGGSYVLTCHLHIERIRIRIQLINLMRIQIRVILFTFIRIRIHNTGFEPVEVNWELIERGKKFNSCILLAGMWFCERLVNLESIRNDDRFPCRLMFDMIENIIGSRGIFLVWFVSPIKIFKMKLIYV
jgi:hypothetical protein